MQTKAVMQLEQFRNSAMSHRDQAGFTLIELLIVIGIIGTLAAVLLPRILETDDVAKQSATEATMLQLSTACDTYKRATGVYPPDNFTPIKKSAAAIGKKDNGATAREVADQTMQAVLKGAQNAVAKAQINVDQLTGAAMDQINKATGDVQKQLEDATSGSGIGNVGEDAGSAIKGLLGK